MSLVVTFTYSDITATKSEGNCSQKMGKGSQEGNCSKGGMKTKEGKHVKSHMKQQ